MRTRKSFWENTTLQLLLLLVIGILLLYSYWIKPNVFFLGDDSLFHLSNIKVISESLDFFSGKWFPSPIVGGIANNLGYGVGLFYPRLPHLVASYLTYFLSFFGGDAITGYKLTHILVFALSSMMMYYVSYRIFKNKKISFFTALFYMTSSYLLSDIIYRDAFAESFLFLFFPMAFLGLYELFHGSKKQFYLWFILGYLGMLHSHLVVSIYLTIFCVLYLLFQKKELFRMSNLKHLIFASVIILTCYLPSVIPLIEHKLYASLAVFAEDLISSANLVTSCAFHPLAYFFPFYEGTRIQFFINMIVWLFIALAIRYRKKIFQTKGQKNLLISLSVLGLLFAVLTTRLTPWQYAPSILLMIQFPWRLEVIVILAASILAGSYFIRPSYKGKNYVEVITVIICIAFAITATIPKDTTFTRTDLEHLDVSNYGLGWSKEYLPMATIENNIDVIYEDAKFDILEGKSQIQLLENEVPYLSFQMKVEEKTTLELPRLHYLGYEIVEQTVDGKKEIPYTESHDGLIQIEVEESGTIYVDYRGTNLYHVFQTIRNVSCLLGILGLGYYCYRKKQTSTKK